MESIKEVVLPPNKMSVAVQVVNGREQGTEEEEEAVAMAAAPEGTEEDVGIPSEELMSDGEDHRGFSKKKKFSMKPWKSIRKIFKRKKSTKGSEGDGEPSHAPNKSKSKSTGELETGGIDGELDKRMSMSEDSVFTPDNKSAPSKDEVRNSYTLNTSNLADEINAKLKERASSSDDGYAQSSEDAMTTGDTTNDNSEVAPLDSSKTDSGIVTTEDDRKISSRRWKSFSSFGAQETHYAKANMKRPISDNITDINLDLIHSSKLLPSSAAKHRISVAPSNRRPSRKVRAGTPEKRSSSRLDDGPTPIKEESTTPTKSPTPLDLDSSTKKDGSQVVIIETPPPEDHEAPSTVHSPSHASEAPEIPCPKEVIIIMKEHPEEKEQEQLKEKKVEEQVKEELKEEKKEEPEKVAKEEEVEVKAETPASPISPEPLISPIAVVAPEMASLDHLEEEKKKEEIVEKETLETEKETEKEKEEREAAERIVEEKRMSVKASKALFEAKIPAADPAAKSSNNAPVINGNGAHEAETRRSSDPEKMSDVETKGEADAKLSEKEKEMEKTEEKDVPVIDGEETDGKDEPVSLKDRISRYQNLATKTSVKGLTSHVPRMTPNKQRPASTSQIENKEPSRKFAPKVLSKPSSTSSNKSKETITDTSSPSIKSPPPPASPTSTSTSVSPSKPAIARPSLSKKPPVKAPELDRCMVCEGAVYANEMCKFQGRVFHRTCQKCAECSRTLTLWNTDVVGDRLYCKQHSTVIKNNQLKETLIMQS